MKKIYLSLLLCILFAANGLSQSISVKNFRLLENDLTANTAGTMEKDQNGETAALIKVVTTQTGFSFDCGSMGVVRTLQKPSEIWVYVPRGVKKMTISHPQLGILRDYYLDMPVESARTYELVLVSGEIRTIIDDVPSSQYVVFQLNPANAVVEIDGGILETVGGTASKMLKFDTYNYRVQAPDHLPEAGSITVNDPDNKHVINIKLKPNYTPITIKVDNDAEIWVNGDLKGNGSWTGNLGAGFFKFEAKKAGFRSTTTSREITISKAPQTIQLQAPTPIYGIAEIESKPAMADIYIDGQKVGQTPQSVRNILVGNHVVVIKKDGYVDYTSSLSVKENQTIKHLAVLDEPNGDVSSTMKKALMNSQSEIPSKPLNKSFKVLYNGVTFKCRAKRGFITITGFDTNAAVVTIPGRVNYANDDYPVKEIDTFINGNNYSARKLIIEEGVETISNFAFMEFRKLIDVTIPNSMKSIGKNAFRNNNGMKFNIPSNISEYDLRGGRTINVR